MVTTLAPSWMALVPQRRAGGVFRHFPNEALVEELFEATVGQLIDIADEALVVPGGWDGLVHLLHAVSTLQADDRGLRETALGTGYGRSRVAALRNQVHHAIEELIARARAESAHRRRHRPRRTPDAVHGRGGRPVPAAGTSRGLPQCPRRSEMKNRAFLLLWTEP